jgi:hypothetical protein
MELIRKMILLVEDSPDGDAPWPMKIDGYTDQQVGYHAYLIGDAGLAETCDITSSGDKCTMHRITGLNSAGHDFAESARMPFVWNEVMADLRAKGMVSASADVLKRLLDKYLRKHLDANDD